MQRKIRAVGSLLLIFILSTAVQAQAFSREEILDEVNVRRVQDCNCGRQKKEAVSPLTWNEKLAQAAQKHADYLEKSQRFSHTGRRGSTLVQRVDAETYSWMALGENLAEGHQSEAEVVAAWMESPGHCANIMNGEFSEMGIGRSKSGSVWVQVFARPLSASEE